MLYLYKFKTFADDEKDCIQMIQICIREQTLLEKEEMLVTIISHFFP